MIFTGFKQKTNHKFFTKKLREFDSNSKLDHVQKIAAVAVFLDTLDDVEPLLDDLSHNLGVPRENIELIRIVAVQQESLSGELVFGPKDFGWYGRIKSEALKSILTKKYDLLINYSKIESIYTNLVILQSNAGFRAGFAHMNTALYDLMIESAGGNYKVFNKELKKYLTLLNKL